MSNLKNIENQILSIIIPTRNREKELSDTLANLTLELNHNIEIIIVDGNSSDNTTEKVNKYQKK
jgi:glycosyltransferase involved in cell wall biosynthesis